MLTCQVTLWNSPGHKPYFRLSFSHGWATEQGVIRSIYPLSGVCFAGTRKLMGYSNATLKYDKTKSLVCERLAPKPANSDLLASMCQDNLCFTIWRPQ